jgi:diguanylate cyclase (GGDEF)-like protein/PAS domain S-box-containing protein
MPRIFGESYAGWPFRTMSSTSKPDLPHRERDSARDAERERHPSVQILFVHGSPKDVQSCLDELKRVRFAATSCVVETPTQFTERIGLGVFDVIVAEYPNANWRNTQVLDLLHEMKKDIPLVFLVHNLERETAADFILRGAADCIEADAVGHLPVVIHRALSEKSVRDQRDRAEKDLRRSEARFHALAENLTYGTCRCDRDGRFVEVNGAMLRILGYESREELLAQGLACDIIQDSAGRAHLLGQSGSGHLDPPIEVEWKRRDHAAIKVCLSGREIPDEHGNLEGYELIIEDVTRQRELEGRLRRQAASDPLTGLGNYRHLVDVLDLEIKRSHRTSREFALLFLDLDGLKLINDRYGHLVGSQALCRLADVLRSTCREIDTPTRFGGDEFAVVLPETSAEEANLAAQRIRKNIAGDGQAPLLSVTIGVAIYPTNGKTIESLLCNADQQLYCGKQQIMQPKIHSGLL